MSKPIQTENVPHRLSSEAHDELAAWVRRSTQEQGLPEKVTDPSVLAELQQRLQAAKA
jgi:hypothetical protein